MQNFQWFMLVGGLMVARGLWGSTIARLPFTSATIYLAIGLALGPLFLNLFRFDPLREAPVLEVVAEVAVLISLFSAGIKMPVPFTWSRWLPAIRLAWLAMALSVLLISGFGVLVLGLPVGAAILLGAILAPTDPVLATDVQVRHAGDNDPLRFTLTCEAGLNDGSAFPFVMLGLGLLGLHELGEGGTTWLLVDVAWATAGGIAVGIACGATLAYLSAALRKRIAKHEVLDDLLGLGLIGVSYGIALSVHTYGFLAVFAAGVALRQTELRLIHARTNDEGLLEPEVDEAHTPAVVPTAPTVSGGALVFKEHLERLSELTLVLLLGGAASLALAEWRPWLLALFVFFIARPLSVLTSMIGAGIGGRATAITAWFGVRGIGSIYYLTYAINHGLPPSLGRELINATLAVIMLSILLHGASVTPLLNRYWR
ncbi:cation:proton antiporter [Massilia niabensis]|uniref:Cation:proton antiporter n=1 Tax=Massilia niabensis TaxID=544910 RepID=A0ABW0LB78_9BURK